MKNNILLLALCSILLSVILIACNKTEPVVENNEIDEKLLSQRILQLENMDEFGAKLTFQSFTGSSQDLVTVTDELAQNLTLENLETVRQQWTSTGEVFKKCEIYSIGAVATKFIRYRIYRSPVDIEILEDSLNSTATIDAEYISSLGSHILGMAALEYLLFKEDIDATFLNFQDNSRDLAYLQYATQYVHLQAVEMQAIWEEYSPEFRVATQSRISGGQNQMTNALIFHLEEVIRLRLGKALGEETGGTVDISLTEAWRSNASLDFIKSGFAEWKNYYSGEFPGSTDNYGFDDYLVALDNQVLVNAINDAVANCESAMENMADLNTELVENRAQVEILKESYEALNVLIKTDLASSIGATITVNDTDGD